MSEPAPIRNEVSVAGFDKGVRGVTPPSNREGRKGVFLTDLVVELGYADRARVEEAEEAARTSGKTVEKLLLDAGTISEKQLSRALAERNGLDHVDLKKFEVDMKAAESVSRSVAARSRAVPIAFAADGALIVAVQDTFDALAIPRLETTTGRDVRPVVASAASIRHLIERLPDEPTEPAPEPNVPRIKSQRDLEVDESHTELDGSPTEVDESPTEVDESSTEVDEPALPIGEVAEPVPEEPKLEEQSPDGHSSFDGLSMDLGPVSMEPAEPETTERADAGEPEEEEGKGEGLLARELSKTKDEVAELKSRLKEAVNAAQDAVAANERLNALRRAIDGKDSDSDSDS